LRRNIYVTNCEENHIGEGIQGAKSTGPVLDDFDDSIESFGGGVRQPRFDKRDDVAAVFSKRIDKFSHGFKTSSESCCSPSCEESFGGPWRFVVPELLKFILEKPSPVDTAVSFSQRMEDARILFGAGGRVFEKEPAEPFQYFAFLLWRSDKCPHLCCDKLTHSSTRLCKTGSLYLATPPLAYKG
jgi:hypothetical protein